MIGLKYFPKQAVASVLQNAATLLKKRLRYKFFLVSFSKLLGKLL